MNPEEEMTLQSLALNIRKDVVRMIGVAHSGRLDSSLSVVDILTYLYWKELEVFPKEPFNEARDRFVLSKALGAPALYATLAHRGFFPREELWNYGRLGAMLQSAPQIKRTPGVDAPGGSLGMGLGIAGGMALGLRMKGSACRVFCLLGDGEIQEGVVWESILSISTRKLDQVIAIVDADDYRDAGPLSPVKNIEMLREKFESFGWEVHDTDGHSFPALERTFSSLERGNEKPKVILARTRSGKGISFVEKMQESRDEPMEGDSLSGDDIERALAELEERARILEDYHG